MTKKLRLTLIIAVLALGATGLLPCNAQAAENKSIKKSTQASTASAYTPEYTFYAAGSSAMFNTFATAAGLDNAAGAGNAALCGENHWSYTNGAELVDSRSGSILPEKGNIWIVWDTAAANQTAGLGNICLYIAADSIVGVRAYAASATISLLEPAGTADGNIVPLLGVGTALPTNIYNVVNGATLNVGMTDIRPEDAKFATIRVLTSPAGTRIPRDAYTGDGYGPGNIGTPIYSSQSTKQANPVDFTIDGPDPITGAGARVYTVTTVGANAVLVIANQTNTGLGHLGDGNYTNINRSSLANVLTGQITRINDITDNPAEWTSNGGTSYPIHVFQREPMSGTFNTTEFCIPLAREFYNSYNGAVTIGQETGVNPALTSGCAVPLAAPCTTENGNPFYHITTSPGLAGSTRARVIGTGEMVKTVANTADGFGYSFWGFSNFQPYTTLKYLTVDGVDPLYSSPAANPGGPGFIPVCTVNGSGVVTACPILSFPNLYNGSYPIWSMQRAMWDPLDPTNRASAVILYAQLAAQNTISDFVPSTPAKPLPVFRSHFNQIVITSNSEDQAPNNGFKAGVPETGGDMGGMVLTVQSEIDYITDTSAAGCDLSTGCQQVNLFQ